MSILTDEIKTFIVNGLACFDSPSEVAAAVKANFDVEVSRQQVHAYDPDCVQRPAPRWCALHAATRAAFLQELAGIGIAQRAFRLRMLDRMSLRAEARGNLGLAASFLDQAAKECGGHYERRRPPAAPVAAPAPAEAPSAGTAPGA